MRTNTPIRGPGRGMDLTRILLDSFEKAGFVANLAPRFTEDSAANPRVILAHHRGAESNAFRISVWLMKYGRRPRPESSRRFRIAPPFDSRIMEYNPRTILLGYERKMGVFAGLDPRRHIQYGDAVPVRNTFVEVQKTLLDEGLKRGFWIDKTPDGEVVAAFWPEMLPLYAGHADNLRKFASDGKTLRVLQEAISSRSLPGPEVGKLPPDHAAFVWALARENKDTSFQIRVKRAYDYRCALSGIQMQLIDAAHIYASKNEDSNDDVSNGIVLQPTLHRAMDTSLIYPKRLGPGHYEFWLNEFRVKTIVGNEWFEGLEWLEKLLRKKIPKDRLPKDPDQHPSKFWIKKANSDRNIPTEMLEE